MFTVDGYDVSLHPDVINAGGIENCIRGVVFGDGAEDILKSMRELDENIYLAEFIRGSNVYVLEIYYSDIPLGKGSSELRYVVHLLDLTNAAADVEIEENFMDVVSEWSVDEIDLIESKIKNTLEKRGF